MPLQKLLIFVFILLHFYSTSQPRLVGIGSPPAEYPDTLYYPFNEDSLQLVIITAYDHWRQQGVHYDALYPRGGSWFLDHTPAPRNKYLWRNRSGELIKQYHTSPGSPLRLRNTDYANRSDFRSVGFDVSDYGELYGYFKFYGENNKQGLLNLKGEVVLPADFERIRRFQNSYGISNRIIVEKAGKFGILDSDLNELFPPIYAGIPEHHVLNGKYLKVVKDGKYGLIDENGKILIDMVFDEIKPIHDSLYIGLVYQDSATIQKYAMNNHWNWGYKTKDCIIFDKDLRVVTKLKDYEYIYYWGISQFIVKKDKYFGVLNTKGEVVIPLKYDHLSGNNGYYHVSKNDQCGLITTEGKMVLPLEFTSIEFYGKAVYVIQNELTGVYNDQFRLIAEPQFKYRRWKMGRFILTRRDGSEGFVNHTEKGGCYYQSPEGEIQKL